MPRWTWLLFFFGIIPFLIARAFTSRHFQGTLPMSDRAEDRLQLLRALRWIVGTPALVFRVVGFGVSEALVYLGLVLGTAWAIIVISALALSPNAEPEDREWQWVRLTHVHRDFVQAVEAATRRER